jgi:hypothetical protein
MPTNCLFGVIPDRQFDNTFAAMIGPLAAS